MFLLGWIVVLILTFAVHIPLGFLFVYSVFCFLYLFFSLFSKDHHVTSAGIIYIITSIVFGVYSGLILFCNYNIFNVLFK